MPTRLREHTFARINENHREVCRGGAGDHVTGILLMAGCVRHDEFAPLGGKETIRHVDGDTLLALGGQAIHQQREIDILPLRAKFLRIGFQCGKLILEDHFGIVK